jgi:hypothetical protein
MDTGGSQDGQIPAILIRDAWLSARSWENDAAFIAERG